MRTRIQLVTRYHSLVLLSLTLCAAFVATNLEAHEPGTGNWKQTLKVPPASPPTPLVDAPVTDGSWTTLPYLMTINPIHVSLMHTGRILIVSGSEKESGNYTAGEFYGGVLDLAASTLTVQEIPWDVFCTGMSAMPDGRFVIIGGTQNYFPFEGLSLTTVFDPLTEKFAQVEDMAHGRWYGSSLTLTDGSVMAYSGQNENHEINKAVELYKAGIGWSAEYISPLIPSLYPRMHLLPDGDVFVSGTVPQSSLFHPSTKTWTTNVATTVLTQNRKGGSSVLLPLRPEAGYDGRVMILGGLTPATKTCEIIDFAAATPAWRSTAAMMLPRIRLNAVLLPNGKVFASGGSFLDEDASTASLAAEIFDPVAETWTYAGTAVYPRLYHSSALLLPDATVWIAGSNPMDTWEEHMEIYSPPYLFTTDANGNSIPAVRPTITSVPAEVGYGASFALKTPDAANIRDVVLVRPGSSTHSFDFDQRVVGLTYTTLATQLKATTPPNGSIAPPGYYMVFIINQAGVPSVAKFVHLSANPTNAGPKGTITAPMGDLSIGEGDTINFSSTATDPNGTVASYKWVFPGGVPVTSSLQSPGAVRFDAGGTYTVSMTALDDAGANDPSPPIRTITVTTNDVPLVVAITQPAAGATVSGKKINVTMTVSGTEDGSSNTFIFSVDGTQVASRTAVATTMSFVWTTASYTAGLHTLTATVVGYDGNQGAASEQVTLNK
ncbi:MAG: DUF1929 domain-containing protein [Chthoniobacterales bacterium]|nr:DUF1929 domain-containing protein [Chthoniobacterales bacterium]